MAMLMAVLVSVGLVAAGTGTAEAKTRKQVGYTQVVVAPAVYDLVTGAGISPAPLDGAKAYPYKGTLAANFPITGYALRNIRIKHSGGISLTAGAATIELRNFYIDLGRGRVSGEVNGTVGNVGRMSLDGKQMVCVFNPGDGSTTGLVELPGQWRVRDVWSGESLGRRESVRLTLPPHSARLLECTRG
jgi:hypothetical protein